ncbi:MAG: NfeD family protein [Clostridia bacterium]|nr:NfeD family protein [Clostridia bacterium]
MIYIWLGAIAASVVIEALTVELVSIWFLPSAIAALILSFFSVPIWVQVLVFFAGFVVMFAIFKFWLSRYIKPKKIPTNADSLIGETATVTEDIDNVNEKGAVKIRGLVWTARTSDDGVTAEKGSHVKIKEIVGNKLIVEKSE